MSAANGKTLINNCTVVTLGNDNKIIPNGAILIEGDTIKAVGELAQVQSNPEAAGATVIDGKGRLAMPGFINAHHHLYSTWSRGIVPKSPPAENFVEVLERLWWPLDDALGKGDLYAGAIAPLVDGLRHGTTTIIDHHESQSFQDQSLDELADACRNVGVRACLTLGTSDRYGKGAGGVDENTRFIRSIQNDPMIKGMMGLHAMFTVEDETLRRTVEGAKALDVGVHVHVAEDAADQKYSLEHYGKRVIERLYDAGALGPKTIAVHCVHLDDKEIDLLRSTGTFAVHNPESNMNNAVGVAPVLKMLKNGITVGLGTDAMTSNMLQEVNYAVVLQRLHNQDPRVGFMEGAQMLVKNNAAIATAMFGRPIGLLAPGAVADVILVDYDPPTPFGGNTFYGHLLFGLPAANVSTAIVGGVVRMDEGKILGIDEKAAMASSRKLTQDFWDRFYKA